MSSQPGSLAEPDRPAILVGERTKDGIFVNPRDQEMELFENGDQVVIIAFERPERLV